MQQGYAASGLCDVDSSDDVLEQQMPHFGNSTVETSLDLKRLRVADENQSSSCWAMMNTRGVEPKKAKELVSSGHRDVSMECGERQEKAH